MITTTALVGQPLCPDCYDYLGHLVWQWWAPELWRRFTITLRRGLARHLGLSETACRQLVRVQFAKVAEFQRRGVIHFHALIRLDGPPTDDDAVPATGRPGRLRRRWSTWSLRRPPRCPTKRPPVDGHDVVAAVAVRRARSTPDRCTAQADRESHDRRRAAPGDGGGVCREVRHQSRRRPRRPTARPNPHLRAAARRSSGRWRCGPGSPV